MTPRLSAPALLLAAFVAGCGDDGPPREPEQPTIGDAIAYWNLAPCTCFEYLPDDDTNPARLGVAVESVTDVFTPGTQQHVVRYRLNGLQRRADFLVPTDPDLLVTWVNFGGGDNDRYWQLDPALPLLRGPIQEQQSVEGDATATVKAQAQPTGEETQVHMRADYTATAVDAATDGGAPQTLQGVRVVWAGLPWGDQIRWFVPQVGFAKLELDLQDSQGRVTWLLHRIRTLGGTCGAEQGWRPGDPIDDICGVN